MPLQSETVLSRQLRLLSEVGVHDSAVVVGYRGEDVSAHVTGRQGVEVIPNPLYRGTGSISSLVAATEHYSGDILLLNSDLVYDRRMLEAVLSAKTGAALVVSRMRARSPHVPVLLNAERIRDVGRHITAAADASFCCAGLVRDPALFEFHSAIDRTAASGLTGGWSRVFAHMAADGADVEAVDYDGPWWDINSVHTYTAARRWSQSVDRS